MIMTRIEILVQELTKRVTFSVNMEMPFQVVQSHNQGTAFALTLLVMSTVCVRRVEEIVLPSILPRLLRRHNSTLRVVAVFL